MFNIESLESRQLLSANPANAVVTTTTAVNKAAPFDTIIPIFLQPQQASAHVSKNGTLIVQGTSDNDTIAVSTTKPKGTILLTVPPFGAFGAKEGTIYVSFTDKTGNKTNFGFDLQLGIKRILVDAGAGNDNVSIDSNVKLKATLIGGRGNDTLIGGPLGDVISGGEGNDLIEAAPAESISFTAIPVKFKSAPQEGLGGRLFIPGTKNKPAVATNFVVKTGGIQERADSADLLEGGAGNDTIHSGVGPDTVDGGAGTDHLVAPGRGNAPKGLTSGGEQSIDFDGLTVRSIEVFDSNGIALVPNGMLAGQYQYSAGGVTNVIDLVGTGKVGASVIELAGTDKM